MGEPEEIVACSSGTPKMGIAPNFWASGPSAGPSSRNWQALENQCSFLMLKGNTFNTKTASVGNKA